MCLRTLLPCALAAAALVTGAASAAGPVFAVVPNEAQPAAAPLPNADEALVAQIDAFLSSEGSPMAGQAGAFVASGRAHGIDPRYLVALTGAESSFGKYLFRPYNPFGWGSSDFSSWADAIETVAGGLEKGYTTQGLTDVFSIAAKYAPVGAANDPKGTNGEEPVNVAKVLRRLGGDPGRVVLAGWTPSTILFGAGTPSDVAVPAVPMTVWGNSPGAQVASIALRYVGTPYVWGGAAPGGFDCSGLAMYAYGQVGITLDHYTGNQWHEGTRVDLTALQPGDLLFFDLEGGDPQHEGIYVGDGLFVQAPHSGDIVRVVPLDDPGYALRFAGAVRPY